MVGKDNEDFYHSKLSMILGLGKMLPSPPGLEYMQTIMATRPLVPSSIHGLLFWSRESQFSARPIAIHQSLYFLLPLGFKYNQSHDGILRVNETYAKTVECGIQSYP